MSQSPESIASDANDHPGQIMPEATLPEDRKGRSVEPSQSSSSRETSTSIHQDKNQNISPSDAQKGEDSEETQEATRDATIEQAKQLQSSLLEIAESIELVKADHDKLEKQNLALQDYIGGLTRAMSKGHGPKGAKNSGK